MKVKVNEKPRLQHGRHVVTITEITEGKSEYKGIPFFAARMETDEGFVEQRFYDSEPSQPVLAELMRAVGLEGKTLDTEKLVGKQLSVEVHERTYPDPDTGQEKTITEAGHFRAVGEADTSQQGQ
ncbi:hypothetical protein GGR26_002655 [Lewinella marina]|uniref:Uncharacterized protein n=1 Tax=Neolewinella marina TaxID=438751 RepID=A0A2G0CD70_9BACT|nr:hypothetical protein [Neolewinella marina]NJB86878.1 hypothetical protein [Neolewinella marina]PHK97923.1 hypothetical protein CGL56_14005 [Neolewinella marina]